LKGKKERGKDRETEIKTNKETLSSYLSTQTKKNLEKRKIQALK
jgi:hypothetical protein